MSHKHTPHATVVNVSAAALINTAGEILIAQRPAGKHMAGYWEFPGGKFEPGESADDAMKREIQEEIGVTPSAWRPLITLQHSYPEKTVLLHVAVVSSWNGTVQSIEGQALKWVAASDLTKHNLLPADQPIANALRLSPLLGITPDGKGDGQWGQVIERQAARLSANLTELINQRLVPAGVKPLNLLRTTGKLPENALQSNVVERITYTEFATASGALHLRSNELASYPRLKRKHWLSGSVHNMDELRLAEDAGCDFVLLGPVKPTTTHPNATAMGWERFAAIVAEARVPVYALGGCTVNDLQTAWKAGAQGVAGITAF